MSVESLRKIPLFSALDDGALTHIADLATEVDLPAGHVLIEAHREGSGMFIVEEGAVVVERGDHHIVLGPGECVGELALLTHEELRAARVQVKEPSRLLAISRADFNALVHEQPSIALALLEVLADRLAAGL